MKIEMLTPLRKDGERLPPGSVVDIEDDQARRLVDSGMARLPGGGAPSPAPETSPVPEPEGVGEGDAEERKALIQSVLVDLSDDPASMNQDGTPKVAAVRDKLGGELSGVTADEVRAAWSELGEG